MLEAETLGWLDDVFSGSQLFVDEPLTTRAAKTLLHNAYPDTQWFDAKRPSA